jgi:histidinol phosphatase-like PHP family hydrolase
MDNLLDMIYSQKDFGDFAGDYLVNGLYSELCRHYLRKKGTRQELIETYVELYDAMFRLTLRMNRLCPVYDDGFIAHIAREVIARDSGEWLGVSERELRGILRQRIQRRNGGFAVDCHVHTSEGSGCACHNAWLMAESAIANGLNAMIITEHNRHTPQARIDELNAAYAPFRVFSGIEIRVQEDDFLVLGLHDEILEQKKWGYIELYQFVRERGGYIALAHPMRYWNGIDSNVYSFRPDALELYSINIDNISWQSRQNALRLANALQVKIIANSDAHATDSFRYCNVFIKEPADEGELVRMLKDGAYRLGHVPVIP